MVRLRTPNSTPVIGYNDEQGFILAGKAINIEPDVIWWMWHDGLIEVNATARKQLKAEVEE